MKAPVCPFSKVKDSKCDGGFNIFSISTYTAAHHCEEARQWLFTDYHVVSNEPKRGRLREQATHPIHPSVS